MSIFKPYDLLAKFIIYKFLSLPITSHLAHGLYFFIYNSLKIFTLILLISFVASLLETYLTPRKVGRVLKGKNIMFGNVLGSALAVVTPVESFSVIPVFVGFLQMRIPVSIAFSYLITAPLTNELAFAVFWGFFGYKVAILYYSLGIIIGILSGSIIGIMKLEKYIDPSVYEDEYNFEKLNHKRFKDRLIYAGNYSFKFLIKFIPFIIVGITIAAFVNDFASAAIVEKYVGIHNSFAIPIAVLIVFFFYLNISAALPIIIIFISQELPLGTILSFVMATTATSAPELLILKKVLKPYLIFLYIVLLFSSIIISGYVINFALY